MPAARRTAPLRTLVAGALLATLLGVAGTSHAATGVVRVLISGALAPLVRTTTDGTVTFRLGGGLPVFRVSDDGAVIAGSIATAMFVHWTDRTPTSGFGSQSIAMVFRQPGGSVVTAAGVATPGGLATTLSSSPPAATLSGTWAISDSLTAGVAGAGPFDVVVTVHYDTNPANTIHDGRFFWARNYGAERVETFLLGWADVTVIRNVRVDDGFSPSGSVRVGTLAQYSVTDLVSSEFVELTAIDFGGVYVLYTCPFIVACQLGGTGSLAHLSGNASVTIPSVPPDIVLNLGFSLP